MIPMDNKVKIGWIEFIGYICLVLPIALVLNGPKKKS